mmetsp:Transcript_213/g.527  ORF Transcript_213/g.527 Transcript_213/m.527 type:complete len:387 (-) Transcript_213:451-1611(-)
MTSKLLLLLLRKGLGELGLFAQPLLALGLLLLEVRLVRVRREGHRLHRVVVHVQAEGGALVESSLRLERRVEVGHVLGDEHARRVLELCLDHAVADRLGDDRLHVLQPLDLELLPHLIERDARVREVDVAQPGADHRLPQPHDQRVVGVGVESGSRGLHHLLEALEIALAHRLHDVQVRLQRPLELRLLEGGSGGDLAHQQLHDGRQLRHCEPEARSSALRRLALRLLEAPVRLRILELHSLDPAQVVQVTRELVVRSRFRHGCLCDQLISLVIKRVRNVVAQEQVEENHLPQRVVVEARGAMGGEERRADIRHPPYQLVRARVVEVQLGRHAVERALVHFAHAQHGRCRHAHGALVVLCVEEEQDKQQRQVCLSLGAHARPLLGR